MQELEKEKKRKTNINQIKYTVAIAMFVIV